MREEFFFQTYLKPQEKCDEQGIEGGTAVRIPPLQMQGRPQSQVSTIPLVLLEHIELVVC